MAVVTITKDNFDQEVLKASEPVLVDFWAVWCGPCRMMSPIMDEIAETVPGVKVGKVNVDDEDELAAQFGIMSIPSILAFKDGKLVNQSVGVQPKENILALVGM